MTPILVSFGAMENVNSPTDYSRIVANICQLEPASLFLRKCTYSIYFDLGPNKLNTQIESH